MTAVTWWDDLNHFVNWLLLCWRAAGSSSPGLSISGLLITLSIAGLGALLAIGWELGEWYAFIRHGTELDTAYEDTLGRRDARLRAEPSSQPWWSRG